MKRLSIFIAVLIISFSAFAHAACDQDSIVGTWKGRQVARLPHFGVANATYHFLLENRTIGGTASYVFGVRVSSGTIQYLDFKDEIITFKVRMSDRREVMYTYTCSDTLLTGVGKGQTSDGFPIVVDVIIRKERGNKK